MGSKTFESRRRLYLLARLLVARHYRRPLTLVAVARALSVSPRALQRAYAQFDDSFHEDLLARRMHAAAQLLAEQRSIPIADVARLVGYRQAPAFAQAFRRRYGLSPHAYRKRAIRHDLTRVREGPSSPSSSSPAPARPRRGRAAPPPAA